LRVQTEVLEMNSSKTQPELGFIKVKVTTVNQAGEAVQIYIGNLVVLRRPHI
jgi:acyl dehydratase